MIYQAIWFIFISIEFLVYKIIMGSILISQFIPIYKKNPDSFTLVLNQSDCQIDMTKVIETISLAQRAKNVNYLH